MMGLPDRGHALDALRLSRKVLWKVMGFVRITGNAVFNSTRRNYVVISTTWQYTHDKSLVSKTWLRDETA